jgi:hypothetical protein
MQQPYKADFTQSIDVVLRLKTCEETVPGVLFALHITVLAPLSSDPIIEWESEIVVCRKTVAMSPKMY